MKNLQEFDESKLIKNPYSWNLKIEVTKNIERHKFNQDEAGIMHPVVYYTERQPATKVYHAPGMLEIVCNLSPNAQRLYLYIIHNIEQGCDYIKIHPAYYIKRNNLKTTKTYRAATKELIRYGFIVASEFDNVFWINPAIFFPGNRIAKYPDNLVEKAERHV